MRKFNESVILDAGTHNRGPHTRIKDISWSPLVDLVELPDAPSVLLEKGLINKVPVIMGTNANEGTMLVPGIVKKANDTNYKETLATMLGDKLGDAVFEEYP